MGDGTTPVLRPLSRALVDAVLEHFGLTGNGRLEIECRNGRFTLLRIHRQLGGNELAEFDGGDDTIVVYAGESPAD